MTRSSEEDEKDLGNAIKQRMEEARIKDGAVMKRKVGVLQSYTQKKLAKPELEKMNVEVLFGEKSLTTEAKGKFRSLSRNLHLSFVLWLLIAEKEVTLEQNPHFYDDLSQAEQDTFIKQALPLEREIAAFARNPHVHILVDRKHHIHVKYAGGEKMYGNVWESTKKKIVLKEIGGKLSAAEEARRDMRLEQQLTLRSDQPDSQPDELLDWTGELAKIARNPFGLFNYYIEPRIKPPRVAPVTASASVQAPVTVVEEPVVFAAASSSSRVPIIVENPVTSTSTSVPAQAPAKVTPSPASNPLTESLIALRSTDAAKVDEKQPVYPGIIASRDSGIGLMSPIQPSLRAAPASVPTSSTHTFAQFVNPGSLPIPGGYEEEPDSEPEKTGTNATGAGAPPKKKKGWIRRGLEKIGLKKKKE